MSIGISRELFVTKRTADIDALKGPFNSVEEALQIVRKTYRKQGREVLINVEGEIKVYVWKRGAEDEDLVPQYEDNLISNLNELQVFDSLEQATLSLGVNKLFKYSINNLDGVISPNSSTTAKT